MFVRRAQLASVGLLVGASVLFGTGLAYAQVPNVDVDVPMPEVNVDVNPDTPSASEINCEIFAQLMANGLPIPQGFDASGCEGGGGGGGGSTAACADGIDNDGDGLVDSADPGCSGSTDNDELNTTGGGGGNGNGGDSGGSGGGSGGNSGGPASACEDSVDNDGDGLKDMNDPGCSSPSDTDETNAASGGGGGGGSASSTVATSTETTAASSTLDVVASCDMYLTSFIKPGAQNDVEQVKRLQSLLNEAEGTTLAVDGVYGVQTIAAVHAFQTKYAADILAPWGVTKSTGFVYLTTRKKVNEIYCKSTKEFPLSNEEVETIEKTKVQITAPASSARLAAPKAPAIPEAGGAIDVNEIGSATNESQTAAAGDSATRSLNRLWDPVTGFFKRIFGR